MKKKLSILKNKFKKYGIDGYIIPKNDEFFGEHSNTDHLKIISNFTGSAGLAVILKNINYLFLDGRYTLQGQIESGKNFKIINYKKDIDTLQFTTKNNVVLQVTVVRDSVIRFRYSTTGKFENDFSYGVTIHASRGYSFLKVTEDETHYIITTSKLILL